MYIFMYTCIYSCICMCKYIEIMSITTKLQRGHDIHHNAPQYNDTQNNSYIHVYMYLCAYIHAHTHTHILYMKFKHITKLASVLFTRDTANGTITFNITAFSIMTLRTTVRFIITTIHTVMCYCYYESHCSECHYAVCRHIECHGTHQGNKDIIILLTEILLF